MKGTEMAEEEEYDEELVEEEVDEEEDEDVDEEEYEEEEEDEEEYEEEDEEYEEDEEDEEDETLTYDKVQSSTDDLNEIVKDGAAVAKELKGAFDDIKSAFDFGSWLK